MHLKFFALALVVVSLPVSAQEREWVLDASEEDVYLLFGVPNTTDVGVSFWCKVGQKDVSLFSPVPASVKERSALKIVVKIGTDVFDLAPRFQQGDGGDTMEAPLHTYQATMVDKLQAVERFAVTIGNHTSTFPLLGADIPSMLKLCNTTPVHGEN